MFVAAALIHAVFIVGAVCFALALPAIVRDLATYADTEELT